MESPLGSPKFLKDLGQVVQQKMNAILCILAVVAVVVILRDSKEPYYRKDPYGSRVEGIDIPPEIHAVPDPPKSVPNPMPPPRALGHRHDREQFGPELESDDARELVRIL